MKARKMMLTVAAGVCVGAIATWGYSAYFQANQPAKALSVFPPAKIPIKKVEEALEDISFTPETPEFLPFQVDGTFAQTMAYGPNEAIEITYVNNATGGYITIQAIDGDVIPMNDKSPLENVSLKHDSNGKFMDNGTVQILYWKKDGLFYSIVASKGNEGGAYTKEELKKIAESFKK